MSRLSSTSRQIQIIQKLQIHPATFKELENHLQQFAKLQDFEIHFSERTLQRDIKEIESLFNLEIVFNRKYFQYEIKESDSNSKNKLLFDAYQSLSILNLNENLKQFVEFESSTTQGLENFQPLLQAAKDRKRIKFEYRKSYTQEAKTIECEPYFLKQNQSRWYLIAKVVNEKNQAIRIFGIDRIKFIEQQKTSFEKQASVKAKELFYDCYGIFSPNSHKPSDVILSFFVEQEPYLVAKPIHHSQEILMRNDEEIRIKLKLFITYDFVRLLLSYGNEVEVIKPKSLINELKKIYQGSINYYSKS
jgi:predicted DNA-binding transcriptional regulator YafY